MKTLLDSRTILAFAALLMAAGFLAVVSQQPREAYGSARPGDEYTATTTAANTMCGATITVDKLIKTGYGALGSVVITGANTGVFSFYDATTTNVNLRTGQKATSTILIASFPASVAAGTYVVDATYNDGLYLDYFSGSAATSTITYR